MAYSEQLFAEVEKLTPAITARAAEIEMARRVPSDIRRIVGFDRRFPHVRS